MMELQDYYEELPEGAHHVELKGSPHRLIWPSICPNCGAAASERVKVRKVFSRDPRVSSDSSLGVTYVIRSAVIPLCAECARRHRESLRETTFREAILMVLRNPAMFAAAAAIAFVAFILRSPVTAGRVPKPAELAISGVLLMIAFVAFARVWWETRTDRVPPLTEIARACDWSDNLGNLVNGERHVYGIRNAAFAKAFAEVNADRLVTEEGRKRFSRIELVYSLVVFALIAVAAMLVPNR
jgi:hypothetical protein